MIINGEKVEIWAEVKTKSKYGFVAKESWMDRFHIADQIGDRIAVHVDHEFDGSRDRIVQAKSLTDKEIIAKGWHKTDDDIQRSFDAGADYIWVVGRFSMLKPDKLLIEPLHLREIQSIPSEYWVVWNARDLNTGKQRDKEQSFEKAREMWQGQLCQASFIKTVKDIKAGANVILVGTYLPEFAESIRNYQNPYFI